MRVVSLACSNTEIVCALGCADLLVGVDDHSDRPAEVVKGLPCVGPDLQIDMAAVALTKDRMPVSSTDIPWPIRTLVTETDAPGLP